MEDHEIKECSSVLEPNSLPNIWLDYYWLNQNENLEKISSSPVKKSNPIFIQKRQRKKLLNEVIDEYAVLNSMPEKLISNKESISSSLQNKSNKKHVNFTRTAYLNNKDEIECYFCCYYCKECQRQINAKVFDKNSKESLLEKEITNPNVNKEAIALQNDNQAFVDINNNNFNDISEFDLDKGLQFDLDNSDDLYGVTLADKKSQIDKTDQFSVS